MFWVTDLGWLMGPMLITGTLLHGGTVVLFEGTPDYPKPDRIWDLSERHRVTHLGISPTATRALMPYGPDWIAKHDLSALRIIGSTGEPWNPEPFRWLLEHAGGGRVPIINYTGGTEISGGILASFPIAPIKPCSFSGPIPGMAAECFGDDGRPVRGAVGELVITKAWPGMTKGFWQDPDRYIETYWSRWKDVWVHGDWAFVDDDGFWYIHGRSDDTLKIAGKRVGPAEVESVLVGDPAVNESAAIGVPHEVKGESVVCFCVLRPGHEPSDQLRGRADRARDAGDGQGAQARARAVRARAAEDAQREDHAARDPRDLPRQRSRRSVVARESGRRDRDPRGRVASRAARRRARSLAHEPLHEPHQPERGDGQRRRAHHRALPRLAAHPRDDGQEDQHHDRLPCLHAEVEREQRPREAARGERQRHQHRRESEAVDQPEDECHAPAMRGRRAEDDVLHRDPHDGRGDHRLDHARRHRDQAGHREREREAVGDRERGDDAEQRPEAAAAQQQRGEEQEMVVAGEDVLDAQAKEPGIPVRRRALADGHAAFARGRFEGELLDAAGPLHLGQRVVIGAEGVEEIVADVELADRRRAREVDHDRQALRVGRRRLDESLRRLAAPAVGVEPHLVLDGGDQAIAAGDVPRPRADQLVDHRGGQPGRGDREAVPDRVAVHRDGRVAGAASEVGARGWRRSDRGEPGHADRDDPGPPAACRAPIRHRDRASARPPLPGAFIAASTRSHSRPTNTGRR